MNVTQYRRIYHCHLKKCGGTTINRWLDGFTSDARTFNPHWTDYRRSDTEVPNTRATQTAYEATQARASFYWSDVVYGHEVLRSEAPPGTFCFTMLRDPAMRVISQVKDWRGLMPSDLAVALPKGREMIADSHGLPLAEFLNRYGNEYVGRAALNNHMTRVLAAGRIGRSALTLEDPESLVDIALQSIESDYHLVGLTERHDLSRNALCAMMGFPPVARLSPMNVSRADADPSQAIEDARGILNELTRFDRIIYDRACQLFQARHREIAEAYDLAAFETHHAARQVGELRGVRGKRGMTKYSVRMPLLGSGFHGRDAVGTPSCAIWTGPDSNAILYIPTPPNMGLSLLVWILGYAAAKQRGQLRVRVNGYPTVHYFEPAQGYADLLTVDMVSTGDFVRLEIDVGQSVGTGEPGSDQTDPRQRGICFDAYGWRPVIDVELAAHSGGSSNDD